jgi:hypothetical protein
VFMNVPLSRNRIELNNNDGQRPSLLLSEILYRKGKLI